MSDVSKPAKTPVDIQAVVKEEVKKNLEPTNEKLDKMFGILSQLVPQTMTGQQGNDNAGSSNARN